MAEEVLNLYQKLAKIRKMTEVIQKNKRGYNYKYTSIDEILARVTAGMEKYHVSLIPKFEQNTAVIVPNNYEKVGRSPIQRAGHRDHGPGCCDLCLGEQ